MARKTAPVVVDDNPRLVEIRDVASVKLLSFELPEAGVVVLEGENGSGKSNVLAGISQALGGSNRDASAADGARMGVVRLGAAELRITQSKSRLVGEVEFSGLESRFDLSKLVDPGLIDPFAADATRLKSLISVANVEGKPELFYPLTDGDAEAFAALGVVTSPDALLMASRVKKAFESHARGHEQAATKHAASAEAARGSIADVDLTAESDETALADAYAEAKSHLDRMLQHNAGAFTAMRAASAAAEQLAELGDDSEDPAELQSKRNNIDEQIAANAGKIDSQRDLIRRATERIAALEKLNGELFGKGNELADRIAAATRAAAKRSEMAAVASAAIPVVFDEEQIASAEAALAAAKQAINAGAAVRRAQTIALSADRDAELAKRESRQAQTARDKAAGVDLILSGLIPAGCPLRYEGGRLVLTTDRDDREPFSELSHGERWRVAIEFARTQLGEGGVLVLPQEAWEALDPTNQQHVYDLCIEHRLIVITARAAVGELRAVVLKLAA
jgi:energy-coupling factor transporter ATP-binding protein EcfA2